MARAIPKGATRSTCVATSTTGPEQHRLSASALLDRLVSTPACRGAGARATWHFDEIDHVMTYFFTDRAGLTRIPELSTALGGADRNLPSYRPVERGVYRVQETTAAPRIKIGADVLPWWPHPRRLPAAGAGRHVRTRPGRRRRGRGRLVGGPAQDVGNRECVAQVD